MTSGRRTLARLGLLAGTLLFLLLAGEAVARLWRAVRPAGADRRAGLSVYASPEAGRRIYEAYESIREDPHPYLLNRPAPNQTTPVVRINARGYRGPEVRTDPETSFVRVLVLGGSVAYGTGATADSATFPSRLEARLCESLGTDVEVVNMGASGYMTTQEAILLLTEGRALRPDAVVLLDGVNDFAARWFDPDRPDRPMVYPQIEARLRRPVRSALASALNRSVLLHALANRFWRYVIPPPADVDSARAPVLAEESARLLRRNYEVIADLAGPTPVVVCLQPVLARGYKPFSAEESEAHAVWSARSPGIDAGLRLFYDAYRREAAVFAQARGARFVDLSRAFEGIDRTIFVDYCHLADEGYDLLAARVAPVVAEALGGPPGAERP